LVLLEKISSLIVQYEWCGMLFLLIVKTVQEPVISADCPASLFHPGE
jgi:hypothetical protein